jgi:DNA-directed RNA polymerase subunit omega
MAQRRNTLMDPPIEDLLDKVDSKFTLVALSAKRARQINSYYNQLGEGLGMVVPPQVTSVSGKPLTIAFEEISASKATYHRLEPGEEVEGLDGTLKVTPVDPAVAAAAEAAAVLGTAPVASAIDLGILDITPSTGDTEPAGEAEPPAEP